jgi:hypothetical protein
MTDRILSPKEVRLLQKRYQELQSEIAQLGWIAQGSLMHPAPNAWRLTRKIKAKTLTTALSQAQASLFVQAINHGREPRFGQGKKVVQDRERELMTVPNGTKLRGVWDVFDGDVF